MLDTKGVKDYWNEQAKKGDNPCHYHNKWQDKYAFKVRTGAFRKGDFAGIKNIVDIGCGVGDYTNEISKLTTADFIAFDFPFNIAIARKKYGNNHKITFVDKVLPDEEVVRAISGADVVITTTVYVHLSSEARTAFLQGVALMGKGSKVMLLEYMPDEVPSFQKNLPHKEVETHREVISKFKASGFKALDIRPVNFIDSFLFHHLGKNFLSYYLTIFIESILKWGRFSKSKYKLLIFEKVS